MHQFDIVLPSKPRVVEESSHKAIFEIDGLYPGYGHTLGNSLRRIILSSLPGVSVTSVKIKGVDHEFSTIPGVKEDVIVILLNIRKIVAKMTSDEPQTLTLSVSGEKEVTAKDIEAPGQVEILNPELHIATLTEKNASLTIEIRIEKGLGFVQKDIREKEKVDIGTIALDAQFSPVRRVNYEVENMRVGDQTNFNRLKIFIETNGVMSPKEVLEKSIEIMIKQLRAIVGFAEEDELDSFDLPFESEDSMDNKPKKSMDSFKEADSEILKTRIDTLNFSTRTMNSLEQANIRTIGGIIRKREDDILGLKGLGAKGLQEIKRALSNYGLTLKE